MKLAPLIAALAVASAALLPASASADYRSGNYWQDSTPHAQRMLVHYQRFKGAETGGVWLRVIYAKCHGDRSGDYPYNAGRGLYHHMSCGAVLTGSRVVAFFGYWATGQDDFSYRTSDLSFQRVPA